MSGPPGLDLEALRKYLDRVLPGLVTGPLDGALIAGGRSNLTYTVTDGATTWVVRRPPLGHVLATAHDMGREHRVMAALRGTAVPVPAMLHLCSDPAVLGAPFYLMEHVRGAVLRDPESLAALGPDRVRALAFRLADTLADLHAVDAAAAGLADFGRPEGFNARQVARWKRQLDGSRSRELPGVDALHERLAATAPEVSAASIVHGDFRLDNTLIDTDGGDRIAAVLDWEMSTLGDPLADLGLLAVYLDTPMPAARGSHDPVTTVPGHPTTEELIHRYAARAGRSVDGLAWYTAMSAFKLAVILEGVHYRYTQGKTVGAGFDTIGARVLPLVDRGLAALGPEKG
ncbi:phosphotransferase family protein [Catenuloplanes atrovinosus]|uniref:Aminoglycoside phosphotransferase (APT) family kinase protein n=1 Tax=Catenuloplanes atrovinosus TaxID=137266 RepID=A0AAE4C869_9ACTN|nr:phosphotransferase family protein [Catenuloplanes atrovinosus]MDR7274678.1 aminoglycoside phosphotransferase (APT) family kinase protein [Catenuloplanes atrovinosus]